MAILASFGIWQFENFVSNISAGGLSPQNRFIAFNFAFPFIIITTICVAVTAYFGIKYQQNALRLRKLVTECLEQLNPKDNKTEEAIDKKEKDVQVKKELAASKIQMSQLVHIVTHDLRGSLRTISSFTTILEKSLKDKLTDQERIHMNFIQSDTKKLNKTIEDIAEFARIEQHLIKPAEYSLSSILTDTISKCQEEIKATKTQISAPDELPNLFCDERKVKEIFTQIVRNAIRYANPGTEPKLDITFTEDDSHVEFKFQDYGRGIPQKSMEKIFLPFTQVKVKNQKGVGIGLAICKKYVELHDGRIWCNSEPGNTTVGLTLKKHGLQETKPADHDLKLSLATTSI